jgi:hypothetical protein
LEPKAIDFSNAAFQKGWIILPHKKCPFSLDMKFLLKEIKKTLTHISHEESGVSYLMNDTKNVIFGGQVVGFGAIWWLNAAFKKVYNTGILNTWHASIDILSCSM